MASNVAAFPTSRRPDELDRLVIEQHLRALYESLDSTSDRVSDAYANRCAEYVIARVADVVSRRRGR